MNLSFKKNVFLKLGGFKNKYWPGEDSKLINALINKEKKLIYYDPKTFIYHHRRNNLIDYLKQHRNYGYMRGMFFAHGDKNSQNITYKIPTIFMLYIFVVITVFLVRTDTAVFRMSLLPLIAYGTLIIFAGASAFLKTRSILIALGTIITFPLTHLVYGIAFMKGYLNGKKL